jgi:hypothetical protein
MTDVDDGSRWGWLDMSRYRDVDPDHAVPDSALEMVRDFLVSHDVAPLPDQAWEAALGAALAADGGHGTAPDADGPADATGVGGAHHGPWFHDDLAGSHGDSFPGPLPGEPHPGDDSHFGGEHW